MAFDERSELTDVNRRSTPAGAKVNGSQNRVKKRYFATLSMTGSAGSTAISLPKIFSYRSLLFRRFLYSKMPVSSFLGLDGQVFYRAKIGCLFIFKGT